MGDSERTEYNTLGMSSGLHACTLSTIYTSCFVVIVGCVHLLQKIPFSRPRWSDFSISSVSEHHFCRVTWLASRGNAVCLVSTRKVRILDGAEQGSESFFFHG